MKSHAMTRNELLNLLTLEARDYRRKAFASIAWNRRMNDLSKEDFAKLKKDRRLAQRMIDALLVDFINIVGAGQGIDYGLCTKYITESDTKNRT